MSVERTDDTTTSVGDVHKDEQQLSDDGDEKKILQLVMCTRAGLEHIFKKVGNEGGSESVGTDLFF